MPNRFNVYLHDTPAQALFAQDVRTYSHGCVRVGDALGLAAALLSQQQGWDRAQVDALIASGCTETIALATSIPVYNTYFTAEPDSSEGVCLFSDLYSRDKGASSPKDDGACSR